MCDHSAFRERSRDLDGRPSRACDVRQKWAYLGRRDLNLLGRKEPTRLWETNDVQSVLWRKVLNNPFLGDCGRLLLLLPGYEILPFGTGHFLTLRTRRGNCGWQSASSD